MAEWKLEFTVVSAANLRDCRNFGRMKVYAIVNIDLDEELTYISPVDYSGETNPVWNFKAPYNISNKIIQGDALLYVILMCERTFNDDKNVGGYYVPLKALFDARDTNGGCFEEELSSGEGKIKFSYHFVEINQATKVGTSAQSSVVPGNESSIVSGVVRGVALYAAKGAAEMIFPGSSTILDLF